VIYTQGWPKKVFAFEASFEPSPAFCQMVLMISPNTSIV